VFNAFVVRYRQNDNPTPGSLDILSSPFVLNLSTGDYPFPSVLFLP